MNTKQYIIKRNKVNRKIVDIKFEDDDRKIYIMYNKS